MTMTSTENPLLNLIDPLRMLGGNIEEVRAGQVLPIFGDDAVDAYFPAHCCTFGNVDHVKRGFVRDRARRNS